MRRHLVAVTLVGVGLLSIPFATTGQSRNKEILLQLGPEPLFVPPDNLSDLVKKAQAAVIAEDVKPGELTLEPVSSPGGTPLGSRGYANYQMLIRSVVYNRMVGVAPALEPTARVGVEQVVGRAAAEGFVSGRIPVSPDSQYLLFLWYRPGARTWSVLQWPLQFRKSIGPLGLAEPLAPPDQLTWLDSAWFGPAVPVATADGVPTPFWDALLSEVRRLGGQAAVAPSSTK